MVHFKYESTLGFTFSVATFNGTTAAAFCVAKKGKSDR